MSPRPRNVNLFVRNVKRVGTILSRNKDRRVRDLLRRADEKVGKSHPLKRIAYHNFSNGLFR